MRIASWNLNSAKARLPRMVDWLADRQPDVLLAQETKATDESWPADAFAELGYESAHLGNGRWNGVAILSRVGLESVTRGLDAQPLFEDVVEPRAIGATCGGLRLWSLYVPNGREVGHLHYRYKLDFLAAVGAQAATERARFGAHTGFGLLGDFNVAPHDDDVWDITAFDGLTHVSAPERQAVTALMTDTGDEPLIDLSPRASADHDDLRPPYTFWEMRMLGFAKGRGMRIDLALVNPALAQRVADVWVDRDARKGAAPKAPSDHAPLVVDLD
ncbi:exodeoxyribonuclease III [Jatrophihabitans telluris]|uniref:Exodeoxyribonuclease III n=1 Tax=Jatrophihabitans telluris TaxID=2038343 RepID=A0ABY4QVN0_9ACTN|nr:exodeoxyribonuclease III [Jatrophihabitans telluris]UQX87344.1 exodeoxyribonuclease III [Jatrophihabitans telluris]